ncbi:MAG: hypothetical protein ABSE62_07715 [Chthoniobacteraceae bacterium]|jgi:hypothetical protein
MTALLVTLSLTLILFGGWGVAALLLPHNKSFSETAAHAWLLGAILVSVALGFFSIIFTGPFLLAAVSIIATIPGLAAIRRFAPQSSHPLPRPHGWAEWTLCVVILIESLLLLRYAWTTALAWDGLMVWEIKARIAFSNGGALPLDYFTDPARSFSHPAYPLMLPMLETWVYLWIGRCSQSIVRVIFPFFYFAALPLLYSGVVTVTGRRWAGLIAAALVFFIPFLTLGQTNLFTGYADFPLAVLYLAAIVSLIKYASDPADSRALLFGIYASALPWMKHEGALLWLCLMLVAGLTLLAHRKLRPIFLSAAPGLIVIVVWKVVTFATRALSNPDFMPLTIGNVTGHAARFAVILRYLLLELSATNHWSILWFVFPLALLLLALRGKRTLSLQLGSIVLIPLILYSAIYILSNRGSLEAHLDSSLARLISHLSLVALLTIAAALPE